jgi:hypothetical protein
MDDAPEPLPERRQELELYRRLVAEDPTAPADLASGYFDHLVHWLIEHNSRSIHRDLYSQAADDAITALIKNPLSYKPSRKRLAIYLRISAQRHLQDILPQQNPHRRGRQKMNFVEFSQNAGQYTGRDNAKSRGLERRSQNEVLAAIREGLPERDLQALDLMLKGKRGTEVFVLAMGLSHLPKSDQSREVRRVKDKLSKRLKKELSRKPGECFDG